MTPRKKRPTQQVEVRDSYAAQLRIERVLRGILPAHLKAKDGVPLREEHRERVALLATEYLYRKLDALSEANTEQPLNSAVEKSLSDIRKKSSEILDILAQSHVAEAINSHIDRLSLDYPASETLSLNDARIFLDFIKCAASNATLKTAKKHKGRDRASCVEDIAAAAARDYHELSWNKPTRSYNSSGFGAFLKELFNVLDLNFSCDEYARKAIELWKQNETLGE